MSEGQDSEKTKELRTTFDSETEKLRESIVLYKETQEGIFYLTAEYRSGKAYIEVLKARGYKTYARAKNFLRQLTDIPEEQVRLKKVTVEDLGFPNGGTAEKILAAAEEKGLILCPPWVGPQYRMKCDDAETAIIGMESLDSDSDAHVFRVGRFVRARYLDGDHSGYPWSPDDEWLFVSDK